MSFDEEWLHSFLKQGGQIVEEPGVTRLTPHGPLAHEVTGDSSIKAVGDVDRTGPVFRSKAEKKAWYEWLPTRNYAHAEHEPLSLRIAGALYKPDLVCLRRSGRIDFIEVKGSGGFKAYKSGRSSKRSLKQCARHFAWLGDFYLLQQIPQKEGGGWIFERY